MALRPPLNKPRASRAKRERDREHDKRRTEQQPWRRWYWTARWRKQAKAQLDSEPLCRACASRNLVEPAAIADHVTPHRGDETLFWDADNLQSLCTSCHSSDKQAEERGGQARQAVGEDGWPV